MEESEVYDSNNINSNNNNNNNIKVTSKCLTNEALLHKGVWGSGYTDPSFLHLGTSLM
jgi:hypothetical protein